jgi:aminoglycoside 3-N-acetyltransferase
VALSVTRSRLAADLRRLGVREGAILMVHARMSAIGWVVGGAETVVLGLLDALGPQGTLMAYASWEEHAYDEGERPQGHLDAYRAEPPVFDVATSEAVREHGRIPERIRTWPGAERSAHPEASVVAVGPRARWLIDPHPGDDGYGADSPFARLVAAGGQVLLLGSPLAHTTLLHHAEAIADVPGKRRVTFGVLMAGPGGVTERVFTDIDTARGTLPYDTLGLGDDEFAVIVRGALAAGIGVSRSVGAGESHLFGARELADHAVAWIEAHFPR